MRRQTEEGLVPLHLETDEGIEEREGAGNVLPRAQALDEPQLLQRGGEVRLADLPGDRGGRLHERAALALALLAPRRPVLAEPPPQADRLADIEKRAGRVEEAVHAGLGGDAGQEAGAELPVEEAHGRFSRA